MAGELPGSELHLLALPGVGGHKGRVLLQWLHHPQLLVASLPRSSLLFDYQALSLLYLECLSLIFLLISISTALTSQLKNFLPRLPAFFISLLHLLFISYQTDLSGKQI